MHPTPTRALALSLALLLVTPLLPATVATHQNVETPPHELGPSTHDVRDEPNHVDDANGFPHTSFQPSTETLVLDSYYVWNAGLVDADPNTPLNALVHGTDVDSHEDVILPGRGYFKAWWGWWQDTGSGGHLQEQGLPGEPDGRIDDAHDDTSTWTDPRHGAWDEFVWRGENPWAGQHGHESHPDDTMVLFIQPGTHRAGDPLTTLETGADEDDQADAHYDDDTARNPYSQYPVANDVAWVGGQGYEHTFVDQSLLVTTTATTAVNPEPLGDGRYDTSVALALDVDTYTTLHPTAAELYRTAVWDPNDKEHGAADAVHEEGPKEDARWAYNGGAEAAVENATQPVVDTVEAAVQPFQDGTRALQGAADDTVAPPYRHEPNHPDDDYDADGDGTPEATHDPSTSYGGLDDAYYEPGPDQSYTGYAAEEHLWLDAQPGYGTPLYLVIFPFPFNLNVRPGGSAAPGFLYVTAHAGTWYDEDGDTWVGTQDDTPYDEGLVDDPNDYGSAEWRGQCNADVSATLTPGTPDGSWGETGVYVVHDPGAGYNPYDDAAADITGDTPLWEDQDGEHLSRLVTHGPIEMGTQWCNPNKDPGFHYGDRFLLFPTGTATYPVTVTTTAHVDEVPNTRPDGDTLLDETVVDVDTVPPLAGGEV